MDPREVVRRESREHFAFLVGEGGFTGPQEIENGLAYDRSGICIKVRYFGPREPEVVTTVVVPTAGYGAQWASLDCLYVAFGGGPAQHVPGSAANLKTVTKRVHQQATALRKILPDVLGPNLADAVLRCRGLRPDA